MTLVINDDYDYADNNITSKELVMWSFCKLQVIITSGLFYMDK